MFGSKTAGYFLGSVVISVCSLTFSLYNISVGADYVGNSGCKCHMGKGCFEGEEYKERLHSNTWEKRLKGTPDAENPDCLKCHATAYGEKIAEVGKKYLPNVQCEACHGAGSEQKKLKENYEGKGKDAFKKDDHRDEDEIDVAIKKLSPEEKKKWAAILPKDEILNSPLKPKKKKD